KSYSCSGGLWPPRRDVLLRVQSSYLARHEKWNVQKHVPPRPTARSRRTRPSKNRSSWSSLHLAPSPRHKHYCSPPSAFAYRKSSPSFLLSARSRRPFPCPPRYNAPFSLSCSLF